MKKIFLFATIAAILAACSSKPKFDLEVNIQNNYSLINKKFIVIQKIDGKVVYADTSKIKNNHFLLNIPYKGTALINISIPESNVHNLMMVAEEGKVQLNIDGTQLHFSGTPLNDRLQAFYQGSDSVSLLFQQLDKDWQAYDSQPRPAKITPQMKADYQQKSDEYRQKRGQLLNENTDRIIAFIKENVDNPVGEYYYMINYVTFPLDRKLKMDSFATPKLRKEFGH